MRILKDSPQWRKSTITSGALLAISLLAPGSLSAGESTDTTGAFGFGGTAGPRRKGDPVVAPANKPKVRFPRQKIHGGPVLKAARPRSNFSWALNGAIPEIFSATVHWRLTDRFAIEARGIPETRLNVRIEMPQDLISTKKNIGVANPEYTIHSKLTVGAGLGAGAVYYPYLSGRDGGGWFVGLGLDQRRYTVTGKTQSPILICSLLQAAKDPPCGDEDSALVTRTEFVIDAKTETSGLATRAWTGWRWSFRASGSGAYAGREGQTIGRRLFIEAAIGAEKVASPKRKTTVGLKLDTPGLSDAETETALGILRDQNAGKSEEKLDTLIQRYDTQIVPVAWLATGMWI